MATATRTRKTASAADKGTASVEELLPQTEAPKPAARRGRPRKSTAPAVSPMFSDNPEETVDTEGLAEADPVADAEAVIDLNAEETPEIGKERRMHIHAEFVPGKSALATLTPDALKSLAFVSTYNTVDEQSSSPRQHGYQRDPMAARFPAIGRYFSQKDRDGEFSFDHLITPIIASARVYSDSERKEFTELFNKGDISGIHQRFGKSVFSIVDGQHRMGGLYWAWERVDDFNPDVPVQVFFGLRYLDEAAVFDVVNTQARRLPKALVEATKQHTEAGSGTHAQTIREIAFALAQDGDSPWHGQINMTGARDPEKPITYEGLRRATGNMMHEKLLARLANRGLSAEKVAKKYWELVARACAPAWQERPKLVTNDEGEVEEVPVKYRLKDLAGVASVSRLGADIIGTGIDQSRTEDEFWSAVAAQVSKLGQIDWEKRRGNPWTSYGAGFAGMTGLYQTLFELLYLDKAPGEAVPMDEESE